MSSALFTLIVVSGIGASLWLISYLIEALRTAPKAPATLRWAPDIPIDYVEVDGNKLRFIKSGAGPILVLLHTLRTQLDLFEKVVPELSKHFTVYALDFPGHGYSDIPNANYDAAFFTKTVEGFLNKLDLRDDHSGRGLRSAGYPAHHRRRATIRVLREWSPSIPTTTPRGAAWRAAHCSAGSSPTSRSFP